jgi:PAS domain S-box-containing protein
MPIRLQNDVNFNRSPARIAGLYAVFALVSLWLFDRGLFGPEQTEDIAFLLAAGKRVLFIGMTSAIVYWFVRREITTLKSSKRLLQAVVEGTTDAVFVKNLDSRYLWANNAAARLLGKTVDEVIGRDDRELFDAPDAARIVTYDQTVMTSGEVVTREHALTSAGQKRTYHVKKAPYRNESGRVIGVIGIARDISDRKAADDALRVSEERFRELSNAIPQIVWTASTDGAMTHFNARANEYSGLDTSELTGWSWERIIHPTDLPNVLNEWMKSLTDGVARSVELRLRSAEGEYRWHIARNRPVRSEDGGIVSWVGTCTDINDLKQAETTLREAETRLREAQRIARLGSWSWEPPSNRVWWSEALFELFGMDRLTVIPSFDAFVGLLHPEDRPVAIARVEAMMAGTDELANDLRVVRSDGSMIWIHSRAQATRDATGAIVRVEGTDQDITARRLAEMAARDMEERLQAAVEVAGLGVVVLNHDEQTAELSAKAAEQFGFPSERTIAQHDLHTRFHPDDRAEIQRLTETAQSPSGPGRFGLEHRVVRPDGSIRWLNVHMQVSFAQGRPYRAVVLTADVTDRRLTEEALRSSEARYRLMFESNPHPMWVFDVDSLRVMAVNDAAVNAYGYSRDEFLEMTILDFRPPEDVPQLESLIAQLQPGPSRSLLWRHRRKDGTVFNVDVSSHDLPGEAGRSRLVLALDVTERLQAEKARDELLARLQLQIDRMPLAYILYDSDVRYSNWNPAAEKIFGYSRDEIIGQSVHFLVHPDDREHVETIAHRLRSGDVAAQSINRNVTKDGRTIICEWHNTPLFALDGKFLGVLSMTLEITDRVRAEEALRESERRLRLALESAGAIAFTWDVKSDTVTRFFSTEPSLPITADQTGKLNDVRARVHPDDLPDFDARLSACISEGTDYRNAYRVVRLDGTIASLEEYGYLDRGTDGSARFLTGISIDVTERVAATEALQISETRYRQLVDLLPTAIFVHTDDAIVYGNPAFVRMMGARRPEELLGSNPFDIAHPTARAAIRPRRELVTGTSEVVPGIEMQVVRRDGRSVPVYAVSAPITGYEQPATLVVLSDLTERERAAELLQSVLGSVDDTIITIDEYGIVRSVNPAAVEQFRYAENEVVGQNVNLLIPQLYRDEQDGYLDSYLRTGVAKLFGIGREVQGRRRDGTLFPAELSVTEFRFNGERHFTGVLRDITERKRLEAQFLQAQKMDAVGQLAGGVAHDFNNLLTVINGYCELLLTSDLPVGDQRREKVAIILDAGEQAARLTQQLLAFSRKAIIEPKILDLNELIGESSKLIRRLIGEDIILAVVSAATPVWVKADPSQLEQVIMNLVVNARDAMPTGGRLTIETTIVNPAKGDPTRYSRLSVSDTGHGMTDEVKGKIFEPFYTTKDVGKGTGLGLAVVHGVITQGGGQIAVESAVGTGTTFHVLLPLATAETSEAAAETTQPAIRGTETIVLVEDEKAVRKIASAALQSHGYRVLEADGGKEAIRLAQSHPEEIHLLVSDVVMPEMGGRQLLDVLRQYRPGLRVLFMSGYTDDAVLLHGVVESTDAFIQKPFTPLGLARKVREVINAIET